MKTRDVDRNRYANYLQRADECLKIAKVSLELEQLNASVINSISAAIAAADALCVYHLGKRHAGDSHGDAVSLFTSIDTIDRKELKPNAQRLSRTLGIKTPSQYEERLVSKGEAEKALKDAERLVEFIKNKVPSKS